MCSCPRDLTIPSDGLDCVTEDTEDDDVVGKKRKKSEPIRWIS